jgi:hypothetical protein
MRREYDWRLGNQVHRHSAPPDLVDLEAMARHRNVDPFRSQRFKPRIGTEPLSDLDHDAALRRERAAERGDQRRGARRAIDRDLLLCARV